MADGTRDDNNAEAVAIVLRHIKADDLVESLLIIEETKYLTVEYSFDLILNTLKDNANIYKSVVNVIMGPSLCKIRRRCVKALIEEKFNHSVAYILSLLISLKIFRR